MMDATSEAERKVMRGYLLGDLPDEDKARLEERFLTDAGYFEHISALEEELIEAYVHQELQGRDRERFEQYFMQSPVQRARVERTAALLKALQSARTSSWLQNVIRLRPSRPVLGFALAAAALLIAVAAPSLLTQQRRLRAQIEQSQAALQRGYELEQQLRAEQKQLQEQQKAASVQIAQLTERLRQSGSPQLNTPILDVYPSRFTRAVGGPPVNGITVRSGAKTVTLLLHSTSRAIYPTYRLEIRDSANNVLWQADGLVRQPTGEYVVTVPTELLSPGTYTLQVYAPNQSQRESLENFRIRIESPQ